MAENRKRGRPPKSKEVETPEIAEEVIQETKEIFLEKSRAYFFPVTNTATREVSIVPIEIKNVLDVEITPSSYHRVKSKNGLFIIPRGWIAIEIIK